MEALDEVDAGKGGPKVWEAVPLKSTVVAE